MKVFVYFNLHRKMWSVKALEGPQKGRVVARTGYVELENVRPRVSQKGRDRVLREKRKNVHAGLVGEWVDVVLPCIVSPVMLSDDRRTTTFGSASRRASTTANF